MYSNLIIPLNVNGNCKYNSNGVLEGCSTSGNNITLTCPSDITVTAAAGATSATVTWSAPTATTTCTSGGTSCSGTAPSDYTYIGQYGSSEYYLSNPNINANWGGARSNCNSVGGDLAALTETGEENFILSNVSAQAFVGLSDEASEGNYQWVNGLNYSGTPVSNDQSPGHDYAFIGSWGNPYVAASGGEWKQYVCEIPCSNGSGNGNLTVTQTAGLPSGSSFNVGTHTITYQATDDCGNSTFYYYSQCR